MDIPTGIHDFILLYNSQYKRSNCNPSLIPDPFAQAPGMCFQTLGVSALSLDTDRGTPSHPQAKSNPA